jgi:glutaconate CoA-transferase subunit A
MAHAARSTLVTVEEIVDDDLLGDESVAAGALPALYVDAIAVAPGGARPLGCQDLYDADDDALAEYAEAARTPAGFATWLAAFLAEPAPALS